MNEYYYPTIGESLGEFQPNLEFKSKSGWIDSGIITCKMSKEFIGFYRVKCNLENKEEE